MSGNDYLVQRGAELVVARIKKAARGTSTVIIDLELSKCFETFEDYQEGYASRAEIIIKKWDTSNWANNQSRLEQGGFIHYDSWDTYDLNEVGSVAAALFIQTSPDWEESYPHSEEDFEDDVAFWVIYSYNGDEEAFIAHWEESMVSDDADPSTPAVSP